MYHFIFSLGALFQLVSIILLAIITTAFMHSINAIRDVSKSSTNLGDMNNLTNLLKTNSINKKSDVTVTGGQTDKFNFVTSVKKDNLFIHLLNYYIILSILE